jgi:serine/threonine-protein kinase RsbT
MGRMPPSFTLPVTREEDRFACAAEGVRIARWAGLSDRAQQELAIAIAELVSNAVRHGGGGEIAIHAILGQDRERWGVQVTVRDAGPGLDPGVISEEAAALPGKPALAPKQPGQGLGLGLGAVQRLVDTVVIRSDPGICTEIVATKFGDAPPPGRLPSSG